ncbi:hypothetical protein C4568_03805 [Candidatus Parcubacteria bacterium]|nr:MAG: hypothetical protein C4568_03805 [Candidatus Parcubacteria bacterium]
MAGKAKTKLVNGVRTDIATGQPATQSTDTQQRNLMTLSTLQSNPKPAVIPAPPPAVAQPALQGAITASQDAFTRNLEQRRQEAETGRTDSFQALLDSLTNSPGVTQLTAQEYARKGGVDALEPQLSQLNADILAEDEGLRMSLKEIDKNTTGLETSALVAEKNRLKTESLDRQAALAVKQFALQGQYDSARAIADRAVAAKLEAQKQKNDLLTLIYSENKDLFTTAEQREFESKQADRNAALQMERDKEMARYNLILEKELASYKSGLDASGFGTAPVQSFEEFLSEREQQLGMNIDPSSPKYAELQQEYNSTVASGVGGGLYNEFDYRTANAVLSLTNKFQDEQVVKSFTNTQRALNIINSIDPSTQNPADHQTVVYSFARSLDPDSVVREGEYATIKKYAQSLTAKYGAEISNAINGTGFLSPGAIASIKQTMNSNYQANLPQYNNIKKQYERNVDQVAGVPGTGSRYLISAESGVPPVDEDEQLFDTVITGAQQQKNGFFSFLAGALIRQVPGASLFNR